MEPHGTHLKGAACVVVQPVPVLLCLRLFFILATSHVVCALCALCSTGCGSRSAQRKLGSSRQLQNVTAANPSRQVPASPAFQQYRPTMQSCIASYDDDNEALYQYNFV